MNNNELESRLKDLEEDMFKIKYPHNFAIGTDVMLTGLGEKPVEAIIIGRPFMNGIHGWYVPVMINRFRTDDFPMKSVIWKKPKLKK